MTGFVMIAIEHSKTVKAVIVNAMCMRLKPDSTDLSCNHSPDLFCLMCINSVNFDLYKNAYELLTDYIQFLPDKEKLELQSKLDNLFNQDT